MRVEDILPIINDNRTVLLMENDEEVARYDGRDSIPNDFDRYEVIELNAWPGGEIILEVKKPERN